jgi:hypothetical protein
MAEIIRREAARHHDRRGTVAVLGVVIAGLALAGCASLGLGGTAETTSATPPATDSSFSTRVRSLFSGSSGGSLAAAPGAATPSAPGTPASADVDCPSVEYRQGAATLAVNAPEVTNSALSLRYQGSFLQTARECVVRGGDLTIKVGVQGRLVVGPAGAPGAVTVPLRYALVREGLEPRTIWTKLFIVPVTIAQGEPNTLFTHIEEEMTVPLPSAVELGAYVIYIGFDPDGAAPPPKPPPKAKPKPKTAARTP